MTDSLAAEVARLEWYHTLELAPGVVTPGWLDTRGVVPQIPFPASLEGKRCLDVGTFNGFWAFEMERRGADEVVAVDVLEPSAWDWPARAEQETIDAIATRHAGGAGFELAKRTLGSAVERLDRSVYELDPSETTWKIIAQRAAQTRAHASARHPTRLDVPPDLSPPQWRDPSGRSQSRLMRFSSSNVYSPRSAARSDCSVWR